MNNKNLSEKHLFIGILDSARGELVEPYERSISFDRLRTSGFLNFRISTKQVISRFCLYLSLIVALSVCSSAWAMNWFRPYDVIFRPELHWEKPWMVSVWAEKGYKPAIGFNSDDQQVNALQIYSGQQDAIAMLNGFESMTPIGQKRIQINAADNGTRGHFCVTGDLNLNFYTTLGVYYKFCEYFWIAAYLPFMGMQLHNVQWQDLTQNVTPADIRVKEYLTNDIFTQAFELGCLKLGGWKRSGLADGIFMLEWLKEYPQRRELLKKVVLNWNLGLNIPIGKTRNEDEIFAVPFGYDGAWGAFFGGNFRIDLGDYFRAGADVRMVHLFGNVRDRRIKTSPDQTELLLLAKARAYKDYGLYQFFTLYAQAYHVCRGFSVLVGYQFWKKGRDTLQLDTCAYSNDIANTSLALREWTVHQAVVNATYDFGCDFPDACVRPQAMLFTRLPFNGRRSADFSTVGALFELEF